MRCGVLGSLEVRDDRGALLPVPGAKERRLLAMLVAAHPAAVTVDRLVDQLWDGDAPPSARKSLQAHVVRLRSTLEPGRPRGSPGRFITLREDGYVLERRTDRARRPGVRRPVRPWSRDALVGRPGRREVGARARRSPSGGASRTPTGRTPPSPRPSDAASRASGATPSAHCSRPSSRSVGTVRPCRSSSGWCSSSRCARTSGRCSPSRSTAAVVRGTRWRRSAVRAPSSSRSWASPRAPASARPSRRCWSRTRHSTHPPSPQPASRTGRPRWTLDHRVTGCPYKGLAAYETEDAPLFRGRADLVERMVALLVDSSLLVVSGSSGAGKSSVVRAGLLPALAAGALAGSERMATGRRHGGTARRRRPRGSLRRGGAAPSRSSWSSTSSSSSGRRTIDPGERTAFLDSVLGLVAEGRVGRCILVIRGDHIGLLAEHRGMAGRMVGCLELVPPLTEPELREVLEWPAAAAGLTVEPELVDTVVREVLGRNGGLPLMSMAMVGTWARRHDDTLTLAGYLAAGGVAGAIATAAEGVLATFDPDAQEVARQVLVRLAEHDEQGALETQADAARGARPGRTRGRVPQDRRRGPGRPPAADHGLGVPRGGSRGAAVGLAPAREVARGRRRGARRTASPRPGRPGVGAARSPRGRALPRDPARRGGRVGVRIRRGGHPGGARVPRRRDRPRRGRAHRRPDPGRPARPRAGPGPAGWRWACRPRSSSPSWPRASPRGSSRPPRTGRPMPGPRGRWPTPTGSRRCRPPPAPSTSRCSWRRRPWRRHGLRTPRTACSTPC